MLTEFGPIGGLHYSPETRPDLSGEEKKSLELEGQAFVRKHAWGQNLNELLLAKDGDRQGILMQPGWLSRYAHGDSSAPISRGVFIRNELLCQHIPPPAMAPEFPEPQDDLSVKQMLEFHKSEPGCSGCHQFFDDLGVAFESFDQNGVRRTSYPSGRSVETDGTFKGSSIGDATFKTPEELVGMLSQSPQLYSCAAQQWVRSATRNVSSVQTSCVTKKLGDSLSAGTSTIEMLLQTVSSDAFLAVEK